MQLKAILRIVGIFLVLFSLSMLPPAVIAFFYEDSQVLPFLSAFAVILSLGLVLWGAFYQSNQELKTRDGFLIVVLFWVVLCLAAAIPMMLANKPHESFTDAVFESVSGFTTTGASIVVDLDTLPHAIRYYRQQLQFMGGMGIVLLAIAILPMLGIGGMQLYRMEMPGPVKDTKLTPRIAQTAKALWSIYLGLTITCCLSFHFAGMSWFDAIGESFATISTGGFSVHNDGFAYYNSNTIKLLATLFMFLGGVNFSLHFIAFRHKSLKVFWQDEEFRYYCYLLFGSVITITIILFLYFNLVKLQTIFINSLFTVTALLTTTGFTTLPLASLPSVVSILLMLLAIIGGCGASTSGGIKVIRVLLIKKQMHREIRRLIHPNAIFEVKLGKQIMPNQLLQSMWAFIAVFIILFSVLLLALVACGFDFLTAFSACVASLANAGVGLGQLTGNFQALTIVSKWIVIIAMLAGRLEIFTLLVLISPHYWRK